VLELIPTEAHDDVHLQVVEQMSHNSQNVRALATSAAAAPLPSFVAHDDVQETSELMDSSREMSPLLIQLNKAQTDVSTNSFGFELQYVATELPERRTASPVLDLVSVEEHVDAHPHCSCFLFPLFLLKSMLTCAIWRIL
jgi:hypothetical protein